MDTDSTKNFPMREAYPFAAANGLGDVAEEIRVMEVDWDRPYTTSVRRGYILREFERHGLLPAFIAQCWPVGDTPAGVAERRRCLRIADEYDAYVGGAMPPENDPDNEQAPSSVEFALEAHLRDFLAKNPDKIESGLRLHKTNETTGVEFPVEGGRIDLLAVDKAGKFVVIELKVSQGRNRALGQLLYYMAWVDKNLGNGPCRGIVIGSEISPELVMAIARTSGVSLRRYRMQFSVEPVGAA